MYRLKLCLSNNRSYKGKKQQHSGYHNVADKNALLETLKPNAEPSGSFVHKRFNFKPPSRKLTDEQLNLYKNTVENMTPSAEPFTFGQKCVYPQETLHPL